MYFAEVTILIQLTEAKECAPLAKSQILDAIQEVTKMRVEGRKMTNFRILRCSGNCIWPSSNAEVIKDLDSHMLEVRFVRKSNRCWKQSKVRTNGQLPCQ